MEIGLALRDELFENGILFNSEVWGSYSEEEKNIFKKSCSLTIWFFAWIVIEAHAKDLVDAL